MKRSPPEEHQMLAPLDRLARAQHRSLPAPDSRPSAHHPPRRITDQSSIIIIPAQIIAVSWTMHQLPSPEATRPRTASRADLRRSALSSADKTSAIDRGSRHGAMGSRPRCASRSRRAMGDDRSAVDPVGRRDDRVTRIAVVGRGDPMMDERMASGRGTAVGGPVGAGRGR